MQSFFIHRTSNSIIKTRLFYLLCRFLLQFLQKNDKMSK